jgi:hypothetical protein
MERIAMWKVLRDDRLRTKESHLNYRQLATSLVITGLAACSSNQNRATTPIPSAQNPSVSDSISGPSAQAATPQSGPRITYRNKDNPFASKPTRMYVLTDIAEERLGPTPDAAVTNRVHKGQVLTVYEVANGWARVSEYYDGRVEGRGTERVARWINSHSLGEKAPPKPKALNIPEDSRIPHLTRVAGDGLTDRDVLILHAAARYYLESGKAKRIEDGDKSVSRPGWYYLNLGTTENTFFKPSDIPDLERRIEQLCK